MPRITLSHHQEAFFLALASSMDNFLVGCSLAASTRGQQLNYAFVLFVSLCNALGCYVATQAGSLFSNYCVSYEWTNIIAGTLFFYLGFQEYQEQLSNENAQRTNSKPPIGQNYSIAFPMTLNNLAGGASGGLVGISPLLNAGYALVVSIITMVAGFALVSAFATGHTRAKKTTSYQDNLASYISIGLYIFLGLQCIMESVFHTDIE